MRRDDDPARLADHPGLDTRIGDLLRSTGPYKAQPGRKQRVLLSLGRSGPRQAPRALRVAIVSAILIGCGAFASAAIGPWRGWIARTYERLVPSPAPHAPVVLAEHRHVRRTIAPPQLASAAPPVAVRPAPVPVAPIPVQGHEPAAPPHVHHAPPPPSPVPQAEEETQVVLEGMRALRLDRDPVRARSLLARYLERHPNGALAEEALALSIEAAVAHHDADAAALAGHYLGRYPTGPFSALAREAQR